MIVDNGVVRFVVPDAFSDRTTYAYSSMQGNLELAYPFTVAGKTIAGLMEERVREIRETTKGLLGGDVAITDLVEAVEIAGYPGARLRSTASGAKHFVHHSIATAPIRAGQRVELRWSVDGDNAPGTPLDRAAMTFFDRVVASLVLVPHPPTLYPGWVAQSCGAVALAVPAAFPRPTSFEFEASHGEKLAVALGTPTSRWWGYFDEALDRLHVRDTSSRIIDGIEERTLVVERHRDELRLTDMVLHTELNDAHAVREANITLHDGSPAAVFAAAPLSARIPIDNWWRGFVHSLRLAPKEGGT